MLVGYELELGRIQDPVARVRANSGVGEHKHLVVWRIRPASFTPLIGEQSLYATSSTLLSLKLFEVESEQVPHYSTLMSAEAELGNGSLLLFWPNAVEDYMQNASVKVLG